MCLKLNSRFPSNYVAFASELIPTHFHGATYIMICYHTLELKERTHTFNPLIRWKKHYSFVEDLTPLHKSSIFCNTKERFIE